MSKPLRIGPRLPNEPDIVEHGEGQGSFGFAPGAFEIAPERLKEFEVDCTPGPIVQQGFESYFWMLGTQKCQVLPKRILDLCAGSGVFGQQARKFFPDAEIVAVEIRKEERANLDRHYDEVHIGDFREGPWLGHFDLVVTNPAFSLFTDALSNGLEATTPTGVVMLLGLNELGTRGSASRQAFTKSPPLWQWRIAGTVGFRGPGTNPKTGKPWGCDTRSYSWWVWQRVADGLKRWPHVGRAALELPLLGPRERTWRRRPGTEE
jgi:hypothetical protein